MRYATFQRGVRALLAAAAILIAFGGVAQAQTNFAIVNFRKCAAESKLKQELDVKFAEVRKQLEGVFQKMRDANAVFLSPAEIKELAGLYEKAQPADADKKRIEALQQLADQRAGAAKRLENTAGTLNDEQKKELEKLAQAQQDGAAALQAVGDEFKQRIESKGQEFEDQLAAKVKDVVAAVAKEKNITLVFNADVVVYAAADITPDVIKSLQK